MDDEFRLIADASDEGVALVESLGAEQLRTDYANPALCRFLSPGVAPLESSDVSSLLEQSNLPEAISSFLSSGDLSYQIAFSLPGTRLRCGLLARMARISDSRAHVHFKPTESSSLEGFSVEDAWRAVAENPVDYLSVIDREGRHLYVNRTAGGLRYEDVVGKAIIYDYTRPEDHERIRSAIELAFEDSRTTTWENYIPILDQWHRMVLGPVKRNGVTYCAYISSKDITAQKRAEVELQKSEEKFRLVAEHAPDVIFLLDAELVVQYVNFMFPDEDGERAVGRPFFDVVRPEESDSVKKALHEALNTGLVRTLELSTVASDHTRRHFSCRIGAMGGPSSVEGLIVVLRDITEQLAIHAQMLQASKLATMGELVAAVGHEINNPLMVLTANAEFLEDLIAREAPIRDAKRLCEESATMTRRIAKIVRGLGNYTRVGDGNEVFCVHEGIRDTVSMLEGIHGFSTLRFDVGLEALASLSLGDPSQFQQILTNLLANARDALVEVEGPRIGLRTLNDGERVIIEVEDNGRGIAEELRGRVFEAFVTTKKRGKGTGLGLSITKNLVEGMGGTIECEALEQGTRFTLSLPNYVAEREALPGDPSMTSARLEGSVLVVDDEEAVLSVIGLLLESLGLRVKTQSSARGAIEELKSQRFDYLISDLKMPEMSGESFVETVAQELPDETRVFLMSGWTGGQEDVLCERVIAGRSVGLIPKPISRESLGRCLASQTADVI